MRSIASYGWVACGALATACARADGGDVARCRAADEAVAIASGKLPLGAAGIVAEAARGCRLGSGRAFVATRDGGWAALATNDDIVDTDPRQIAVRRAGAWRGLLGDAPLPAAQAVALDRAFHQARRAM